MFKKWPQEVVGHSLILLQLTLRTSLPGDEEGLVVLRAHYQQPQHTDLQLEAFLHLEDLVLVLAR